MVSSRILFYSLLSFMAGIFVSSFLNVPKAIIFELFLLGLFYLGIVPLRGQSPQFKKAVVVFGICLVFLGLGAWRTEAAKPYSFKYPEAKEFPFKQKLKNIIYKNFSPPHSNILAALLLGDKKSVSQEWNQKMNVAGVRHVAVVSGMHIVIISGILLWLGINLGLPRGKAFYFSLLFVWLFIALIGFQPAAVRAGIMGSVFLLCQKLGRQNASARTLFSAAAVMLAIEPFLLRYNVGFQLSFLATMGIIYLGPFLQKIFEKAKLLKFLNLAGLLAMTFSAQIFVLPFLICIFGYVSLVSPLTNILIVPISSFLMAFGFLFLLASLIWQPLGFVVFLFVWIVLDYFVLVVDIFSKMPFASVSLSISRVLAFAYYSLLVFFLWRQSKKAKKLLNPN